MPTAECALALRAADDVVPALKNENVGSYLPLYYGTDFKSGETTVSEWAKDSRKRWLSSIL